MVIKNKKILITAGPTWVAIDNTRVISNTATGKTGILLAEMFSRLGANVTLLLGPVGSCCLSSRIKVINYSFFDELEGKLSSELKKTEFDCVIHSAAVSDYRPLGPVQKKISSGKKYLNIRLKPTKKIIELIKKVCPSTFLVGFKYEPDKERNRLYMESKKLMNQAKADLVVANTLLKGRYLAYLADNIGISGPITSKRGLVTKLINTVSKKI